MKKRSRISTGQTAGVDSRSVCVTSPPNPCRAGAFENEKDAPSMGPSPIINIKKEKRETEEETKEILRKLERDNVGPRLLSRNV